MAKKKKKRKTKMKRKGTTKKKTTRKKVKKKAKRVGRPRGRRSKLSSASIAELKAEFERRQNDLLNQREELQLEIDQIDVELSDLGMPAPTRRGRPPVQASARRGRRGGKTSLADSLQAVLRGKTMGVGEAAEAVKKAGYKTKSKNFRTIVNLALIQNPDKFRKVARGQYTAK